MFVERTQPYWTFDGPQSSQQSQRKHQKLTRDDVMRLTFSCLLFSLLLLWTVRSDPDYYERLDLQPLTPPSLLASFHFRSNASLQSYEQQHFRYIPRSLGQILQHAKTQELHLRFSSGRWDDEGWGTRPWNGTREGGIGVELWAWVEADSEET